MPAGYAPLPTRQPTREADRELDEAFASDEEDELQHDSAGTPLSPPTRPRSPTEMYKASSTVPAVYDFERDFDYVRPPPGSPPRPSAFALPNDFGNSNGLVPSSPIATPAHRPSFFRRAIGAILPTHYTQLPTTEDIPHPQAIGGGTQNDGVFANVTAKPSRPVQVRTDDGSIYIMPEETQNTAPPSYAVAQADPVPPYWETTVHAPAGLDTDSGMIIDDLPSGSIFVFVANLFTSFFFQFVGFMLTYLLHTTHAAKFGSRAGLGLTLIQYGFYSRAGEDGFGMPVQNSSGIRKLSKRSFFPATSDSAEPPPPDTAFLTVTSREWLSFLLMTLGWFLLLSSLFGFWRIKHWETSIRASQARAPSTADETERDITTRRTIENAVQPVELAFPQGEVHIPTREELNEARLRRELHSAGLL
ncbi:hypothetical protein EV363DRAFT_1173453 [Boletus edulis]|nr:hypothetical protein EV363DRAFT_1173453 [Boletus edulis]